MDVKPVTLMLSTSWQPANTLARSGTTRLLLTGPVDQWYLVKTSPPDQGVGVAAAMLGLHAEDGTAHC